MRELETLLPDLAPPAGGLARLQHSVAARRSSVLRVRLRWAVVMGVACAIAVIVALRAPPWLAARQRTGAIAQALRRDAAVPTTGIRVANGAAIELPSGQANARLYLVQAAAPER